MEFILELLFVFSFVGTIYSAIYFVKLQNNISSAFLSVTSTMLSMFIFNYLYKG